MGTSSQIGYLRDMIKCKLFFANNFERTGVWSAFCYCTFEEGPAIYCGRCTRSTQKCTYTSGSTQKCTYANWVSSFAAFPRLYTLHHTLAFRLSPTPYTLSTTSIANSLLSIAQSPKAAPCTICRTSAHTFQVGAQWFA